MLSIRPPYRLSHGIPAIIPCDRSGAYAQIGIGLPRTAAAQHDWFAHGNGFQVPYGQEQPGDLILVDTHLGPNQIGHVMIVFDPAKKLTIEAGGTHVGNYPYTQWTGHHMFSIWRLGTTATTTGTAPTG
jgi:cell wall-associated NlpC family hydrolase